MFPAKLSLSRHFSSFFIRQLTTRPKFNSSLSLPVVLKYFSSYHWRPVSKPETVWWYLMRLEHHARRRSLCPTCGPSAKICYAWSLRWRLLQRTILTLGRLWTHIEARQPSLWAIFKLCQKSWFGMKSISLPSSTHNFFVTMTSSLRRCETSRR